jgi:hypothetical protein
LLDVGSLKGFASRRCLPLGVNLRTSLDSAEILNSAFVCTCQRTLPSGFRLWKTCGADRDRTDDIQLAKLALSQLSYSPSRPFILPRNLRGSHAGGHRAPALYRVELVGLGGLEPPTSRLSGARSSQLSYRPREAGCAKRENPIISIQSVKEPRRARPFKTK